MRTRSAVECPIGLLKGHWVCLSVKGSTLQYQPTISGWMIFLLIGRSARTLQISEPVEQDLANVSDLIKKKKKEEKNNSQFSEYVFLHL